MEFSQYSLYNLFETHSCIGFQMMIEQNQLIMNLILLHFFCQKLMMVDCSQLPYDIIRLIAIRLHAVEDFLSFSFVCHSWRSFYLTKSWTPGPQIPWLMLSDNENSDIRSFFSLYKNKVYELELPEARGRRCWGSPHGWIVIIGSDLEIHLLNPFSRACINLPPQSTFDSQFDFHSAWYKFIDKAIIIKKSNESHTIEEEFLVMVIYGPHQDLAFSRPGYSSWVNVEAILDS
ncbi:probable F-box protein At4g22165 [Camellia sinensis]|uniref:probable F-box protein At4g22165 n=1 Tax=Camellia sinensis TaxID=4442 RepID=UPI001036BB6E|nr:probable F-box protein At4g22165 [Camellia sinensis]